MSTYAEYKQAHQVDIDAGLVDVEKEKRVIFESMMNHYLKGLGMADMKRFIEEHSKKMPSRFYKEYFDEVSQYFLDLTANFELDVKIHTLKIELGEVNPEIEREYLKEKIAERLRYKGTPEDLKRYFARLSKDFYARCNKEYFQSLCDEVLATYRPIQEQTREPKHSSPTKQSMRAHIHDLFKEFRNPNGDISELLYYKYKQKKEILIPKR